MLDVLRDLWLHYVAGPDALVAMRMASFALFGLVTILNWWNVFRPNEHERTWANGDYKRVRAAYIVKTIGLTMLSGYLLSAGILEAGRTSSPLRLIFANAAQQMLCAGMLGEWVFWRLHYYRKAALQQVGRELSSLRQSERA